MAGWCRWNHGSSPLGAMFASRFPLDPMEKSTHAAKRADRFDRELGSPYQARSRIVKEIRGRRDPKLNPRSSQGIVLDLP